MSWGQAAPPEGAATFSVVWIPRTNARRSGRETLKREVEGLQGLVQALR